VCFDGTDFLAVWTDGRSGYWGIYGSRVSQAGIVLDSNGIVISPADAWHESPCVACDGVNWLVVWTDWLGDSLSDTSDIYGAQVTSSGMVLDEFPAVAQAGSQCSPALATGLGNQTFLVYQGWVGTVSGKTYDNDRIWGKLGPFTGVEETPNAEVRTAKSATIVRGVLLLQEHGTQNTGRKADLLDISGKKVMELHPGANDVSRLSPGVYFVRAEPLAVSRKPSAVTVHKVILTR
jgi:hypothetical protein